MMAARPTGPTNYDDRLSITGFGYGTQGELLAAGLSRRAVAFTLVRSTSRWWRHYQGLFPGVVLEHVVRKNWLGR